MDRLAAIHDMAWVEFNAASYILKMVFGNKTEQNLSRSKNKQQKWLNRINSMWGKVNGVKILKKRKKEKSKDPGCH